MFKVRIIRNDGQSFGETEAIAVDDLPGILKVLSKPSMFGTGNFKFELIPC